MHYKTGVSRHQASLFNTLDESIGEQNYVRLIDALVEMLYGQSPEKFQYRGTKEKGRKSYHPCDLLKLYLYGYLNRISSSRRLESETYRNIEVKWLLHDLHPDHKTIADYRKDNTEAIRYVTLSFRRFLRDEGFISGEKIIYDGSKIKACVSKEKVLTEKALSSRIKKMEDQLHTWLSELNNNDHTDELTEALDSCELSADINKSLLEEIVSLRQKIKELEEIKSQIKQSDHSSYCPTDPDAHLMKSRDGFIPAYNLQGGTDAKHKMIVLAELTPDVIDLDCIENNVNKTKEQLGLVPEIVEADKGYDNIDQIKSIESNGITSCAIPLKEGTSSSHDKKAGVEFRYDQSTDSYTCSKGKLLKRKPKNVKQESAEYLIYQAKASDCRHCALFGRCTTFRNGRRLKVKIQDPFREEYAKRMETEKYQALIKERKDHIEHIFGTMKRWMGKVPLLLTGKRKVQAEIDLYASCYNLKRLMNIEDMSKLLERIANYAQKAKNILWGAFFVGKEQNILWKIICPSRLSLKNETQGYC
ncbi:transposase [Parabacteroides sp. PFB2-12]|uniref:IS1182 family transposase n=1 Tax=unclassified Parabacteroides TaxID=2649774 RepID=UPI00247535C8|nr:MULTISPECIES: IS1182 family transposase [unclassified Parabacteroides]MDH6342945.1 transposase [Parabacteroides sp. PM6-13]MDH6391040.1 transposase [Parabacteroides sp. PFB2-12]